VGRHHPHRPLAAGLVDEPLRRIDTVAFAHSDNIVIRYSTQPST
jgi:hypothetical protein